MKIQILATAALLTATIMIAAPTKAENPHDNNVNLSNLPAATDLQSSSYDPYPFGTVERLVLRTDDGGVNCLGQVQLDNDSRAICAPKANMTTPTLADLSVLTKQDANSLPSSH